MTEENTVIEDVAPAENTEVAEVTEPSTEETKPSFIDTFEYSFDKKTQKVESEDDLKELVEMGRYYKEKGRDGDNWLKEYAKDNNMSKSELLEAFKQQKVDNEIQAIADKETVSVDIAKRLRNETILTEASKTKTEQQAIDKRQDEQISLFVDKHPDVENIPQDVLDRFAKGDIDLNEAYDMFSKDSTIQQLKEKLSKYEAVEVIDNKNTSNAEISTGSTTGNGATEPAFTKAQIKNMSREDIRKNYKQVIETLQGK